tara:strand:- start:2770 stop:2886 length:117 start_codon:yes stop_codon:yes gene_type:complete
MQKFKEIIAIGIYLLGDFYGGEVGSVTGLTKFIPRLIP